MKKDTGPNPGEEFFYKLSLKAAFEEDLIAARQKLKIPSEGFADEEEHLIWQSKPGNPRLRFDITFHLQKKYGIPLAYLQLLNAYLLFGETRIVIKEKQSIVTILPPAYLYSPGSLDMEDYLREHNEPYVRVLILGNGRKSDVLKSIENSWDEIEEYLKSQGWTRPKKVRTTIHKDRNKLIKKLWRKPIQELRDEVRSYDPNNKYEPKYREILIQRILKHRGYGTVPDTTIKKIGSTK